MNDLYTPLHNEILEALAKINLSPYETRVLFVIWRKTYGFVDKNTGLRKKFDWIAGVQISEMTGLDRRLVYRALQGLKKKNVIIRDDNKTGFSKKFMRLMSSKTMTSSSVAMTNKEKLVTKMMTPSDKNDDILSSKLSHTKEKKETNTKENTPQAELVIHFSNLFNKRFQKPYMPFRTDYMNMATLLKIYPIDKLKTYVEWYMHWDSWQTKYGFNIGNFFKNINSITSSASPFNY